MAMCRSIMIRSIPLVLFAAVTRLVRADTPPSSSEDSSDPSDVLSVWPYHHGLFEGSTSAECGLFVQSQPHKLFGQNYGVTWTPDQGLAYHEQTSSLAGPGVRAGVIEADKLESFSAIAGAIDLTSQDDMSDCEKWQTRLKEALTTHHILLPTPRKIGLDVSEESPLKSMAWLPYLAIGKAPMIQRVSDLRPGPATRTDFYNIQQNFRVHVGQKVADPVQITRRSIGSSARLQRRSAALERVSRLQRRQIVPLESAPVRVFRREAKGVHYDENLLGHDGFSSGAGTDANRSPDEDGSDVDEHSIEAEEAENSSD